MVGAHCVTGTVEIAADVPLVGWNPASNSEGGKGFFAGEVQTRGGPLNPRGSINPTSEIILAHSDFSFENETAVGGVDEGWRGLAGIDDGVA